MNQKQVNLRYYRLQNGDHYYYEVYDHLGRFMHRSEHFADFEAAKKDYEGWASVSLADEERPRKEG